MKERLKDIKSGKGLTMDSIKRSEASFWLHNILDISLTILSFVGTYYIKIFLLPAPYKGLSITPNYYIILFFIILVWYLVFNFFDLYRNIYKVSLEQTIWDTAKCISTSMIILITILYILKMEDISRILLGLFFLLNFILIVTFKIISYKIHFNEKKKDHNIMNYLVVGSKTRSKRIIDLILSSQQNCKIIGCVDPQKGITGKSVCDDIKVIGTIDDLKDILTKNVVDEVIFAMPLKDIDNVDIYMLLIEMVGVKVRIFPDWQIHTLQYKPSIARIKYDFFIDSPTLLLTATSENTRGLFLKQIIDFLAALFIFILSSPFFILISIAIKFFSWGPIFFKQERVGLNGRKFKLYKFRSMVVDAEKKLEELKKNNEMDGPAFKMAKDPRIIPYLGHFIRKTGLDELPQLINILKGEMSLVGPRPPLAAEVEKYEVWQRRKLSVKPGLTCLWQIAPRRNDLTFYQWMDLDLEYIDKWSIKMDIQILLKTFLTVITGSGR